MNTVKIGPEEYDFLINIATEHCDMADMVANSRYPLSGWTTLQYGDDTTSKEGLVITFEHVKSNDFRFMVGVSKRHGTSAEITYYIDNQNNVGCEVSNVYFNNLEDGWKGPSGELRKELVKGACEYLRNWAKVVLAVEYCVQDPKKIIRPSLNTTQKCSNKARKRIYRTLKNVSINYTNNDAKGHHRPPAFEFMVKGHWRTYKNGRRVWIKPHIRCEGRGQQIIHEYQLF